MEAFASATPEPPASPTKHRRNRLAQSCETTICNVAKYFPLAFVYGVTTWAIWVEASTSIYHTRTWLKGTLGAVFGISLYLLMNGAYTVAVFTDPGTPLKSPPRSRSRHQYSHLPTSEDPEYSSVTVNSSGGMRYCKKCQGRKPDRTHHCSTCGRCVLKMDHHCPWLATCVGLHNYKAFLLFLIYTCLFCYVCFVISVLWVWDEMLNNTQYLEKLLPVNVIILSVVSGMFSLVLSGFAGWHISLAVRGLTTIECLEKTRYLAPVRKTLDRQRREWQHQPRAQTTGTAAEGFGKKLQGYGQQFIDMHANSIPGVTRAEEGEERASPTLGTRGPGPMDQANGYNPCEHHDHYRSPAQQSLFRSYGELDRAREHDRYEEYLAECDSEKLPHAFDLGWRRNLLHLFGPNPFLWPLPISSTTGDGWRWESSSAWEEARHRIERQRIKRWEETHFQDQQLHQRRDFQHQSQPSSVQPHPGHVWPDRVGNNRDLMSGSHKANGAESYDRPSTGVSMKTLRPRSPRVQASKGGTDIDEVSDHYSTSSDEDTDQHPLVPGFNTKQKQLNGDYGNGRTNEWRDWE